MSGELNEVDPPMRMALAERLRTARDMAGLSQGQVAKKLGVHRPSVSEIEAGCRRVSAEELIELAGLYAVDLSWLAGVDVISDEHQARVLANAEDLLAACEMALLYAGRMPRRIQDQISDAIEKARS